MINKKKVIEREYIKPLIIYHCGDVKKLQNNHELYRLRVGSYRIIFHYVQNEIIIDVTNADNRGDIYKNY